MTCVLVTVGSGFIGQHLVAALQSRGQRVRILDLRPPAATSPDIEFAQASVLDQAAVESALVGHDAVLEAAVVPKEDGDGLLKPKAFIVLKPGKSAANGLQEALQEHVKAKAGLWKYPRWIEFVDGLPKTATGKIQRYKLREQA